MFLNCSVKCPADSSTDTLTGSHRWLDKRPGRSIAARPHVAPSTVQRALRRAGLATRRQRLTVLEHRAVQTAGLLTERTRRALWQAQHGRPRHVAAREPGELVCLDTFYIGQLKGVGKVWQSRPAMPRAPHTSCAGSCGRSTAEPVGGCVACSPTAARSSPVGRRRRAGRLPPGTAAPAAPDATTVAHRTDCRQSFTRLPTVRVRFAQSGLLVTELLAVSGLVGTGLAPELAQRLRRLGP